MRMDFKHRIGAATVVLALLLLASIAWQAWLIWQQESAGDGVASAVNSGVAPAQRQTPSSELSNFQLFGNTQANALEDQQNTLNLPETNLQLVLRGVLAADGDFRGSALVEDNRNNTDAYLVGDALPGNATLRSVHPARIIIERSGKLENLYFPETDNLNGFSVVADESQNTEPADTLPALSQPTVAPMTSADEQRRTEIRERLEKLRNSLRDGK